MANNHEKLWLQQRLNKAAIEKAKEAILATGRALPCKVESISGSIVTVSFELDTSPWVLPKITIPKAESNWVRMATQVGDTGFTVPADVYIGHISGLGESSSSILSKPANLSSLVFVPVSNSNSPSPNNNASVVQGPDGFIGQTTQGTASSVVTNQSGTTVTFGSTVLSIDATSITMTAGGKTIKLDSSGFTIEGKEFFSHQHSGVTSGSSNSGGVV